MFLKSRQTVIIELKKLNLPYHIDAAGNILVTKGDADIYPCVVSHMDTVHRFVPNFRIYQNANNKDLLLAVSGKQKIRQVGIGGDDKCGVFACLYLLKIISQIKVVFFSREESGCIGSKNINKSFFDDCSYLIQLDRRGKGDFIQSYINRKTVSQEFSSEIETIKKKYNYKSKAGFITDVMSLWENKVGISCVNLSCGYYNPHSNKEYISITDLWRSIKFTEEIIYNLPPKRYISLPPKYEECDSCGFWKSEDLIYKVKYGGVTKRLCWLCHQSMLHKKMSIKKSNNNNTSNMTIPVCHNCGKKASDLQVGDCLKYRGTKNHLYCDSCAALFFVEHNVKEPIKCFVCNKIIPKDHKIIKRFGVRVCEDCACPSDTIILETQSC